MEAGYSKWRKLDNAALAYPAVTKEENTKVFRFYCKLKGRNVDGEILQEALDQTIRKYPLFQAVLRKGLFWYYLERRDIRPLVQKEEKPPCSRLYIPDKKSLLFQVSYHEDCINFEVFHSLTDGTGAMQFLLELVQDYLQLAYPETKLPRIVENRATAADQEEDSFSQYYNASVPKHKEKKPAAVQMKGGKMFQGEELHITEVILPVSEILAKARQYHVSVTVFTTAVFLCAIQKEIPRYQRNKPVTLMIPVNLRNFFPSRTMSNFFGWIEVGHVFTEDTTFEDVLVHVKEQFAQELTKEKMEQKLNGYVSLERNPFLRVVPLEIKKCFLKLGAYMGGRSVTSVYSNVGIVRLPEEYREYIERFGIFVSTDIMQMCSCSYGDEMVMGFTSRLADDSILRNFLEILETEEISYKEEKDEFPGLGKEAKKESKRVFQSFSFACVALVVLSAMVNYFMDGELNWFWMAAAGALCMWLIVTVAYNKRRNILKNEMWELLLITLVTIIWDYFTGWRRWSVDFVVPIAALSVLLSIPVIAKVQRLAREEYLFYLVQAGLLGCVPMILVWTKVVRFVYPSVICAGISFLALAALFIFLGRDTLREFRKKLRM